MVKTREELSNENITLRKEVEKYKEDASVLTATNEILVEENKALIERERNVLLNIISQMFAKPVEREYPKGEIMKGFSTPNLSQNHKDPYQEWTNYR